ncbi:hypothetical protein [Streptomyces liangshanensis]|uniref:hypothetical protein n=1 Tax=Streptomyces liangshanensis TaxID=2717324 RepID=UPI0036DB5EF9
MEQTLVASYVRLVEDGADDLYPAAEDLGGSDGDVRRLLLIYAAEPHEVVTGDGRRFFLVQTEVYGEFRNRSVVRVASGRQGRVFVAHDQEVVSGVAELA